MTGMALQIGTGFKEIIIKFQVQVMGLEIHDEKNRGHRAGEFAKSVQNVLRLQGDTGPEFITHGFEPRI